MPSTRGNRTPVFAGRDPQASSGSSGFADALGAATLGAALGAVGGKGVGEPEPREADPRPLAEGEPTFEHPAPSSNKATDPVFEERIFMHWFL
jgi:hypothetical protein